MKFFEVSQLGHIRPNSARTCRRVEDEHARAHHISPTMENEWIMHDALHDT